jgi:hypothetical protein
MATVHKLFRAPDLFLNELSESFELLSGAPQIGHLYRPSHVRGVRRLLLQRDALPHLLCGGTERSQGTGGMACTTRRRHASAHSVTEWSGFDRATQSGGFGRAVLVFLNLLDGLGGWDYPI